MKMTPRSFKWLMNLYPPLFFNRIRVVRVSKNFKEVDVVIKKSLLNKNIQGTIFGGTLFSAADPYYSMMYYQIFSQKGLKLQAWLRAAEINYIKPGTSDLSLKFRITDEELNRAIETVEREGRIKEWHTVNMIDTCGDICVEAKVLVYIKKITEG